ncbi:heat shock protein DnaJ family protein [Perkinsela sp. CCAP 1560/4]|nr:heat shock protein DnaJ family protein [Perkinsela sp. CCAP 1560/4]|eukprot:KNH07493.1 heat shock protein DnaJ family protein [Perkinsela sp. CCAP 1560/4]
MFYSGNIFGSLGGGFGLPDNFFQDSCTDESFASEEEDESPPDRQVKISLSLEQCYNGANVEFKLKRLRECLECQKGRKRKFRFQCDVCQSKGFCTENATIYVEVPRGTQHGFQLRLHGEGDISPGNLLAGPGDLVVHCVERPHERFQIDGNDYITMHRISWAEAITGASFVIEHLDGRKLLVEIKDEVVQSGDRRVILGEGVPIHDAIRKKSKTPLGSHGNLIVILSIDYPKKISASLLRELRKILPKASTEINADCKVDEDLGMVRVR